MRGACIHVQNLILYVKTSPAHMSLTAVKIYWISRQTCWFGLVRKHVSLNTCNELIRNLRVNESDNNSLTINGHSHAEGCTIRFSPQIMHNVAKARQ